ncbi:helix-turn-helix domain-containing protein [Umezawaea endophytica]|uniref:Helix-turn-helix domain-containing protein n=1 Tax=Umezawaea endophytica TaxID=1654476 RepID=A0A9X3A2X2_9PSEU|nr:helix-turn-helix transcriptional regulator [Umezawaea endophytica]MCS7479563.1 helix-turn-helix domain-containing protein [Umezawaea endophytica]
MSEQEPRRESTTRSRRLGSELRDKRMAAGWRSGLLAAALGWSLGKVSKLESGVRGASDTDVAAYLALCRVRGAEFARLVELSRESGKDTWVRPFGDDGRTATAEHDRSTAVTHYACMVVPGPLRTPGYARALGAVAPPRRGRAVFYLEEQVLLRPVGGRAVMHDQLMHLLLAPAEVRVVPTGAGAHAGVPGSFALLDATDGRAVVHLESMVADVFLENPEHVARYRAAVEGVAAVALDVVRSREVIGELADLHGGAPAGA